VHVWKFFIIMLLACSVAARAADGGRTLTKADIIAQGEQVADAQLAAIGDISAVSGSARLIQWSAGVMWAGYADFSHVSEKPDYGAAILKLGESCKWMPLMRKKEGDANHADDLCICQAFLDAFAAHENPAIFVPVMGRLNGERDAITKEVPGAPVAGKAKLLWWWCDSLFMAPASLAQVATMTQQGSFLDAMNTEWWRTAGVLYDKDEHLFYRDLGSLDQRTASGGKVFWSRGNGWVFAGLARTLNFIPASFADRGKYIAIYKAMAARLAGLQQADGTWPPSLLSPEEYPDSEMSGTALDCFGFAWGVENGILDRATYMPVIEKAWAAMMVARRSDGLPGYVQGVASAPALVSATGTQLYATGAYLMAASVLAELAPIDVPAAPTLRASTLAAPGELAKGFDTVIDPAALTLDPAKAKFGASINGLAFQQNIIVSSTGWQYTGYYDGSRKLCVARRHLPDGPWEVLRFDDYSFQSNDAHNTVSVDICAKDGTIHLAFDHHVSTLHYRVSKPGVATKPENFTWSADLFGPVRANLEPGPDITVTYPRFINTPDGGLQFQYRKGGSGDGEGMLADYDPQNGTWSGTRQLDSSQGTYTDVLSTSVHRNAYPNGFDYDAAGRLQATWVWREDALGSNHDLMYDYSDDRGKTWHTDDGAAINGPAAVDTPGLVVEKISRLQGLMNSQAQAIDSKNRMHVIMWDAAKVTGTSGTGDGVWGNPEDRRYHHYWREGAGQWHDDVLPWVAGSRPRLFVDAKDNLFLIYSRPEAGETMGRNLYFTGGDLVIATATAAEQWKDWRILIEEKGPFMNEMIGDTERWKKEKVLSVIVQDTPKVIGTPSELHVIDYKEIQ
jgi:rhamnogalacturonyl hydrolase YesR